MHPSDSGFTLNYWDKSVAINRDSIQLILKGNGFFLSSSIGVEKIDGWYAEYSEGVFVFFKDGRNRIFIGWDQKLIDVNIIARTDWSNRLGGRIFECFDDNNVSLLRFGYNSFKRFYLNPLKLVGELLMPDDEWGLVADLPSFVHSSLESGNIKSNYKKLLLRDSCEA